MGCSCSTQQALRFKNLVVAVYPRSDDGDFNKDAMSKLRSYVASNPDRIPRVCRKVTKLVFADIASNAVKRVTVGAHILRDLVDSATEFEAFVPCCVEVSLRLFGQPDAAAEFRIAAADIVSVVSVKIQERSHTDSARRLLSDSQCELLRSLKTLMEDGIGTNDIISLHCRYAGLVAAGNLADCFPGSQLGADQVVLELIPSVLLNLNHLAKSVEATPSTRDRRRPSILPAVWVQPEIGPITSVTPPLEADQKDAAFLRASIRAVAGLSGCCTSIGALPKLLSIVNTFSDTYNAWASAPLCVAVFHTVTSALQRRPQQLGYSVVQFLVDEAHNCSEDDVVRHTTLLECISSCVEVIPLTSSRPHAIFEAVRCVITKSSSGEESAQGLCVAAASLTRTLAERTSLQRNWAQLSRMVAEVLQLLPKTQQKVLLCAQLKVLSCLLRYVSQLTEDDRQRLCVVEAIQPYLNAADDMRAYAARCLTALVAPPPEGTLAPSKSGRAAGEDVESAQMWLRIASRSTEHSAFSLVEMGHVATAVIFNQRVKSLPFVLPWILDLQQRNANLHSELSRAFLHMTLAVMHAVAEMLPSPELALYAVDLASRRSQSEPSELPQCFAQKLSRSSSDRCGLVVSRGSDPQALLSSAEEGNSAGTTFITLSTLVVYTLRTVESAAVLEAFGATDGDGMEKALRQRIKEFGESTSQSSCGSSLTRRSRKATESPMAANLARGTSAAKLEPNLPPTDATGQQSASAVQLAKVQFIPQEMTPAEKEAEIAEAFADLQSASGNVMLAKFNEMYGVKANNRGHDHIHSTMPPLAKWSGYDSFADPNAVLADAPKLSAPNGFLSNTSFTVPLALARRQKGFSSGPAASSAAVVRTCTDTLPRGVLSELDTI